jgi:hypothetical protein
VLTADCVRVIVLTADCVRVIVLTADCVRVIVLTTDCVKVIRWGWGGGIARHLVRSLDAEFEGKTI